MTTEHHLYDVLDIATLELPEEIKQMRYKKTLGEFYVTLSKTKPNPLYEQITPYHMDYLPILFNIEASFRGLNYQQVITILKTSILKQKGYILQGRMYYNLLDMMEKHIPDTLKEFQDPVELKMRAISEPNIFEYRIDEQDKKELRQYFSRNISTLSQDKIKLEFNEFLNTLNEQILSDGQDKEKNLEFTLNTIRKDIKTDPLTLVMFHDNLAGQYQTIMIARGHKLPYQGLVELKTDGVHFYAPGGDIHRVVNDFRMAMIITVFKKMNK